MKGWKIQNKDNGMVRANTEFGGELGVVGSFVYPSRYFETVNFT